MKKSYLTVASLVASGFMLSACDQKDSSTKTEGTEQVQEMTLSAENPVVRKSTGPNTAAYMIIKQAGSQPDTLVKAECEHANLVELHDHVAQDGVMKMRPVDKIIVPGNGQVEMKPGSLHIMLMGLKDSFQTQDKVIITLHFERAGKLEVACDLVDNVTGEEKTEEPAPADVSAAESTEHKAEEAPATDDTAKTETTEEDKKEEAPTNADSTEVKKEETKDEAKEEDKAATEEAASGAKSEAKVDVKLDEAEAKEEAKAEVKPEAKVEAKLDEAEAKEETKTEEKKEEKTAEKAAA